MGTTKLTSEEKTFLSFRGHSIQRRLLIFICILLLTVIIAFSWMSYEGIKRASLEAGNLRLQSLSGQLSSLFGQSAQTLITATRTAANDGGLKKFIQSGGKEAVSEMTALARKLQPDSTWALVEVVNKQGVVIPYSDSVIDSPVPASQVLALASGKPDTGRVGKIYIHNDSMYYAVMASVADNKEVIGYIIRWRLMQTTQEAINRFSMLLGDGVALYVGNADGSLWTDLKKPVTMVLQKTGTGIRPDQYSFNSGSYYAATAPVNNTHWRIMTSMSVKKVSEPPAKFLGRAISTGVILLVIGIFITWLISRSIIKPLKKLNSAAAAIAGGDYSEKVLINSRDEIGQLAHSFNIMTEEVHQAHKDLESKVQQRTNQLEESNKELEAFSYSVSHDLRAPLRAISGYTMILKEDHSGKLDAEATRILNAVISNATMMGRLIDDLISFSKINKRETLYHQIDMKIMAELCFRELQQHEKSNCRLEIADIPSCYGDGSLMKQVWINLIGNAIKYSSKTPEPLIRIGYRQENNRIIYFIADNGAGFDMKYAHKLFGVFQRLHKYEEYQGTGIGLALVKRILNKQGGDIWAEGEIGKGATFFFSMPMQNDESSVPQNDSPKNMNHGQ